MKKLLTSPWVLLAAICLLRLPGFVFGVLNIDESDYLTYAAGIWKGLLPYRDLVEIKPPLGYFTYALAGGLAWPIRALAILWVFGTAMFLRAAARRWTGSEEAGWAAAWLSLLAGFVEVPWFSSELMMNLPIAAALYFFVRRDLLACGFFIGVATLYRHQSGIAAIALGLAVLYQQRREPGRALAQVSVMALGSTAPWVLAAAAYAAIGQFPAFFEWSIKRGVAYASHGRAGSALARAAGSTALCVGATCVVWVLGVRETFRPRPDVVWRGLVLLLWMSFIPVALGGRFYEHYYLQFVPPLAVLAAPGAAELAARWRELLPRVRGLAIAGVAVPLAVWLSFSWGRGLAGRYPEQEPRAREAALWLRAHSAPADTLFVWGHYSPIYTLSHRLPGTRYVNTSPLIGNFDPEHLTASFDPARSRSQPDVEWALADLDRRQPEWFVDTSTADIHNWGRIPVSTFPELLRYRAEHYTESARPGGVAVYSRRELPAKQARRAPE